MSARPIERRRRDAIVAATRVSSRYVQPRASAPSAPTTPVFDSVDTAIAFGDAAAASAMRAGSVVALGLGNDFDPLRSRCPGCVGHGRGFGRYPGRSDAAFHSRSRRVSSAEQIGTDQAGARSSEGPVWGPPSAARRTFRWPAVLLMSCRARAGALATAASAPCLSQNRNAKREPEDFSPSPPQLCSSSARSAAATGSGSRPGRSVAMRTSGVVVSVVPTSAMARLHWTSTFATVASSSNETPTSTQSQPVATNRELGSVGAAPLGGLSYTRAVKSWRSVYRRSRSIAAARVQVRPSSASWSGRAGRPCVRICAEGEGEARGERGGADVSRKRLGAREISEVGGGSGTASGVSFEGDDFPRRERRYPHITRLSNIRRAGSKKA